MTTKHTKGPWRFDNHSPAIPLLGVYAYDNKSPWHVVRPQEELEANARLIAAAPDLLNQLLEAVELQRKHYGDGMVLHMEMAKWAKKASAAIAKATGEPPCAA